jgi:hypothetical protein
MEYGRFAQVDALKAKGWHEDEETELFHSMDARDMVCGGPTYLRNPNDGLLYACSGGTERLVNGRFALTTDLLRGKRFTMYENGQAKWAQG